MDDLKSRLSQWLFWDVDLVELNPEKNAAQIIEKVITRGDIADWHEIREYYGLKRIAEEAKQLRYLDDLTLNFVSRLFNIPKEEFRCYQLNKSIQVLGNFKDLPVGSKSICASILQRFSTPYFCFLFFFSYISAIRNI